MSKRNAIIDLFLESCGAIEGFSADQVIDGPIDHLKVASKPLLFAVQIREPNEHNGSGRQTYRKTQVLTAFVMKVSDDKAKGSERQQLNAAYDPIHAGIEQINESDSQLRLSEDDDGVWFMGFNDKDRRVAALCMWQIDWTRKLGSAD